MLDDKTKGLILNILKHINRILKKTTDLDVDSFLANDDIKEIVCFNLFQIGELAKRLDNDFILKYSKVPWSNIKGMRDIIVHSYSMINLNRVFNTVKIDLPPLKEYLESILSIK